MRMMLQKLATHIWPKDQPGLRLRVVVAVSLLIGAKVLLVLLKYVVSFSVKSVKVCHLDSTAASQMVFEA